MAAEQYGHSTNNYQAVWNGFEWIITSDAEWAANDTITIASEISDDEGFTLSEDFSYKVFTDDSEELSWRLLDELSEDLSYKIFSALIEDASWRVLSLDLISDISWKIFIEANPEMSYKINAELLEEISHKIFTGLSEDTSWKILSEISEDISWKLFNLLSEDSAWKISAQLVEDISWAIVTALALDEDLSWKIYNENVDQISWKTFTEMVEDTSWKIPPYLYSDISWVILAVSPFVSKYLKVLNDDSSSLDILCDGFIVRLYRNDLAYFMQIFDPTLDESNRYASFNPYIDLNGSYYYFGYSDPTITIIKQLPTRIDIKVEGNFHDYATHLDMPNSVSVTYYISIYSDKITMLFVWVTDGNITLAGADDSMQIRFSLNDFGVTNKINMADFNGTELYHEENGVDDPDLIDSVQNACDYIGITSDEIDVTMHYLGTSESTYMYKYFTAIAGDIAAGFGGFTMPAGNHWISTLWTFDTSFRLGGKVGLSQRQVLGPQYSDKNIGALSEGSWLEGSAYNQYLGLNTSVSGSQSDGSHRVKPNASNKISFVADRDRLRSELTIADWDLQIGDVRSPTSLLDYFWECDSTTLTKGAGTITLSGATYVPDLYGTGIDCSFSSDRAVLTPTTDIDLTRGSISFYFRANEPTLVQRFFFGSYNLLSTFSAYVAANGDLIVWVGVKSVNVADVVNNFDLFDGKLHSINISWVLDNFIAVYIDSRFAGFEYVEHSTSYTVSQLVIGNYGSTYTNSMLGVIDHFKIFNDAILPWGAKFAGNSAQQASLSHQSLLFYWDTKTDVAVVGSVTGDSDGNYVGTGGLDDGYYDTNGGGSGGEIVFNVANNNIVNPHEGCASFWFYLPTNPVSGNYFFYIDNSAAVIHNISLAVSGGLPMFMYTSGGLSAYVLGNDALETSRWYYAECCWSQDDSLISLYLNDSLIGTDEIVNPWTGLTNSTLIIGAYASRTNGLDCYFSKFFITDNANRRVGSIPTAYGKIIHTPLISVT